MPLYHWWDLWLPTFSLKLVPVFLFWFFWMIFSWWNSASIALWFCNGSPIRIDHSRGRENLPVSVIVKGMIQHCRYKIFINYFFGFPQQTVRVWSSPSKKSQFVLQSVSKRFVHILRGHLTMFGELLRHVRLVHWLFFQKIVTAFIRTNNWNQNSMTFNNINI